MTGPERIWAFDYDLQDNDGTWRNWQCWSEDHPKPLNATEYIRRDPAVLTALPEVQAMIAAARLDYRKLVAAVSGNPSGTRCDACRNCGMIHCADAFYGCPGMRDYTLSESTAALAARDAAMRAAGMREAAGVATSFLVGDPLNYIPLRNPMAHEVADAILARAGQVDMVASPLQTAIPAPDKAP